MPRSFLVKKAESRSSAFLDGGQNQRRCIGVENMSTKGKRNVYIIFLKFDYVIIYRRMHLI
jgi:hypothetical protein